VVRITGGYTAPAKTEVIEDGAPRTKLRRFREQARELLAKGEEAQGKKESEQLLFDDSEGACNA
jgi:hypothetical protein